MKKKLLLPVLAISSVLMLPALEFIEQLDESEVKQLHKKIKELDSYNDELIRDNNQLRNELDNQEVLSEEWIGEHKYNHYIGKPFVYVDDLQNLLVPKQEVTEEQVMRWLDDNEFYDHATAETVLSNAVDKEELIYYGTKYSLIEKPVIPKFVADWIEACKEFIDYDGSTINIFDSQHETDTNLPLLNTMTEKERAKVYDWIVDYSEKYARAWIGGYEVEEEHKYYAFTKAHKWIDSEGNITYKYWKYYVLDGRVFLSNRFSTHNGYSTKMSKSEWNKLGVNDSNADFEEVTE